MPAGQDISPLDGQKKNGDFVEIILTSEDNKSEKSSLMKDETLPENLQVPRVNLSYSLNHLVNKDRVFMTEEDGEVPQEKSINKETSAQTEGSLQHESQKDLQHQIYVYGDFEGPQYELNSNPYPSIVQSVQRFQEKLHTEGSLGTSNLHSTEVQLPLTLQRSELQTSRDQQECQPYLGSINASPLKLVTDAPSVQSKEVVSYPPAPTFHLKDPNKNCLPDVTQVPRGWMRRVTTESGNRKVHYFSTVGKKFTDPKEIANHFARLGQTVKQGVFNFN
jgi:hypothetical protein